MKKMYIRAYCQSNLGDDLFVLQLARRYPDTQFYLYALGENQNAFRNQPNLILPGTWDRIRRKLNHTLPIPGKEVFDGQGTDGRVAIGGSVFWEGAPTDYLEGTFLIGANCEDSYSPAYRQRLGSALASAAGCCFRDRFSYEQFRGLPGVTWAPDVLYGWAPAQSPRPGRGIGISVVARKGVFQDDSLREAYYNAIAGLCDLCREEHIPVKLLGFCRSEGDKDAMEAIRARTADPENLTCVLYEGDVDAFLEEMNGCETILATRFHAMILGWVLGKNVVPILYSSKQTHVLEDAGFQGPMWNALKGETCTGPELLEMARRQEGRLDISQLRQASELQFAALDKFIKT